MEPECAFPFLETSTLFPATAVEEGSFLPRSLPAKEGFRKQLQGDLTLQVLRPPLLKVTCLKMTWFWF